MEEINPNRFVSAEINLEREGFFQSIVMALSGTLQDTVGIKDASGFVSLVGMSLGEEIAEKYERANGDRPLDRAALIDALIDLKRRIGGDFFVVSDDGGRIVLGNRRCPFGDGIKGFPSLCMMTSNVFGHLVAESQGYGRVTIEEAIAAGSSRCRIVIDLEPDARAGRGRQYFKAPSR